jgi:hypothetical protein
MPSRRVCLDTGERRGVWWPERRAVVELAAAVCGAWVFPRNVAKSVEKVTCAGCLNEMVNRVAVALAGNRCIICNGTGWIEPEDRPGDTCHWCKGTGKVDPSLQPRSFP